MRSHSARPKNRTRTPKYHPRSASNLLDPSSQSDIESCTTRRSQSSRNLSGDNVFFHHHQHHHNYYLPRVQSSSNLSQSSLNSQSNPGCEIKKFLIYAILFFLAYYLLFIAITTTYRHNIYTKNIRNPMIPDRVQIVTSNSNNPPPDRSYQSSLRQIYEKRKQQALSNYERIHGQMQQNKQQSPSSLYSSLQDAQNNPANNPESIAVLKEVLGS